MSYNKELKVGNILEISNGVFTNQATVVSVDWRFGRAAINLRETEYIMYRMINGGWDSNHSITILRKVSVDGSNGTVIDLGGI